MRKYLLLVLGVGLLTVAALLLTGTIGTYPGSTASDPTDEQAQAAAVSGIQRQLARTDPSPERPSDAAGAPTSHLALHPLAAGVWTLARIGRLDLTVPVHVGTDESALATGLGHWRDGVKPGQRGNYVLAGHRVTHTEPFADFTALQPGDDVVVETSNAVYTYALDTAGDSLRVDQHALWLTGAHPPGSHGRHVLTLITCAETYHTDDRYVAFGHLTHTRWKTTAASTRPLRHMEQSAHSRGRIG